ncbi:MAG TPA: hypothetical protein VGX03_18715 [Candidatus Binatia bacterium]|jgi:DNA topoisomerase-1|nr:hypothetical protein [Candidatus Binatia bacterium]
MALPLPTSSRMARQRLRKLQTSLLLNQPAAAARAAGQGFTVKDFRTWAGTVLVAVALRECETCASQTEAKKNILQAIATVATRLGNTPAICRNCYIHPAILDSYLDGSLLQTSTQELKDPPTGLHADEVTVLAFLQQRLASVSPQPQKAA